MLLVFEADENVYLLDFAVEYNIHATTLPHTRQHIDISQYLTNLMHKIIFHNKFYFMPLHVSSTCAHHQEVKIALHSNWYHHSYRWPSRARVELSQPVHETATYRCDDTRGCVM